jgi:hypothetical protein
VQQGISKRKMQGAKNKTAQHYNLPTVVHKESTQILLNICRSSRRFLYDLPFWLWVYLSPQLRFALQCRLWLD